MSLVDNPARMPDPGDSRTCGTHRTGKRAPGGPVPALPLASRALWFLEVAAVSLLLDLGWQLEPSDPNRSGLVPPADHWTGLGGRS